MFKVVIAPQAQKELRKIPRKYQQAIRLSFFDLKEDPSLGKPLSRELTGRFSYRVGVYRIIYKVNTKDKIVAILTAGHRLTAYR